MERHGSRVDFNRLEFNLTGIGCVALDEVSDTVAQLYRTSDTLMQETFYSSDTTPGDMSGFNRATDIRLVAEKLEAYAPETSEQGITAAIDGLEALLMQAPGE